MTCGGVQLVSIDQPLLKTLDFEFCNTIHYFNNVHKVV